MVDILIAAVINLILLRFFISQRVPEVGGAPIGLIETLTSQRREPWGTDKCLDMEI